MPMEPVGHADPGPNAILVSLSDGDLRQRVTADLDSFDGYVGVNNHMGSRFTAYRSAWRRCCASCAARGLLFLDSRTTPQSVGDSTRAGARCAEALTGTSSSTTTSRWPP